MRVLNVCVRLFSAYAAAFSRPRHTNRIDSAGLAFHLIVPASGQERGTTEEQGRLLLPPNEETRRTVRGEMERREEEERLPNPAWTFESPV